MATETKKKRKLWLIPAGILGALFLCVVVVMLLPGGDSGSGGTPRPTRTAKPTSAPTDTRTPKPTAPPTDTHTPKPSATPVDTATPLPSATPSPLPTVTPDWSAQAKALQEQIVAWFKPAEAAGNRVQEQVTAIAEGKSQDTVELGLRAKRAAEAYESVKFSVLGIPRSANQDLQQGIEMLALAAIYREEAYRAIYSWIDTRKDTDLVTYREKMDKADSALVVGLASILSISGQ
jgi:hypothetical protein